MTTLQAWEASRDGHNHVIEIDTDENGEYVVRSHERWEFKDNLDAAVKYAEAAMKFAVDNSGFTRYTKFTDEQLAEWDKL